MSGTPKNIRRRYRPITHIQRWWRTVRSRFVSYLSTGRWGERKAVRFLEHKGLVVLATNWRDRHLEGDIIACDRNAIVIVEVKTRHARLKSNFPALGSISAKKQSHLTSLGRRFMRNNGPLCRRYNLRRYRIDIIEVYYTPRGRLLRRVDAIQWHRDFGGVHE